MNSLIYDITENFNFNNLKLENPSLINANNYFSKIYNNNSNKNFYIKLPKCKTKHGIVNSNNKCFCELEFNSNEKIVAEFFENLENFCIKEICANKSLWFYDSENISNDDIQEYITPIMRSYRGGKKFLIKTNIKQEKLIVYDENEKKLSFTEYDVNNEVIPLININGIKFSKSSFIIDIILVQFMVLYPSDSFENQILIKLNKQEINSNKTNIKYIEEHKEPIKNNLEPLEDNLEQLEDNLKPLEDNLKPLRDNLEHIEDNLEHIEDNLKPLEKLITNDELAISDCNLKTEVTEIKNTNTKNNSFKYLIESLETIECNNDGSIELNDLDTIAENTDPIELKTHETIYLEIYKKAKHKAKQIRKNAIEAFLEAKNIRTRYNLDTILDDSSSDDENELLNMN